MDNVLPWRPEQPEPEPTEAVKQCRCGSHDLRMCAHGIVLCVAPGCGAIQPWRWKEMGND